MRDEAWDRLFVNSCLMLFCIIAIAKGNAVISLLVFPIFVVALFRFIAQMLDGYTDQLTRDTLPPPDSESVRICDWLTGFDIREGVFTVTLASNGKRGYYRIAGLPESVPELWRGDLIELALNENGTWQLVGVYVSARNRQ